MEPEPEPGWANWLTPSQPRPLWRRLLVPGFILVALSAAGWFAYQFFFPSPPSLPGDQITGATITLNALPKRQNAFSTKVTDARELESLLSLLRAAQRTSEHKCGDSGEIEFELKDGSSIKLGILAGHDKRYYKYRTNRGWYSGIFRIDRPSLERALGELGVTGLDPGFGE